MTRPALLLTLAATLTLAASGCGGDSHTALPDTKRTLTDLHSISQLQTAFNNASDEPRLVVLVSPT
jgi:hypothetical protein